MKREEIPKQYQWKMEDLYASNEAWEADFSKLQRGIEDIKKYEGTLAKSAENLLKMHKASDELNELAERI